MFSVKRISSKSLIVRLFDSLNNAGDAGITVAPPRKVTVAPSGDQIIYVITGFAASFIICIIVIAVCSLQLMKYRRNG